MSIENINFPEVDINEVLRKNPNRFLVAVAAAKRARQIKEGARPLIDFDPNKPMNFVGIALKEILEGKVDIDLREHHSEDLDYIAELDKALEDNLVEDQETELVDKDEKKALKDALKPKKSKSLAA